MPTVQLEHEVTLACIIYIAWYYWLASICKQEFLFMEISAECSEHQIGHGTILFLCLYEVIELVVH